MGNRLLGRIEGRDGDDGPEDLLLHDAPLAVEAGDHCRLQEVAVPDALREIPGTLSAGENGAPFLSRELVGKRGTRREQALGEARKAELAKGLRH